MTEESVLSFLLPREEENDPRFRHAIQRLSVIGLRVIASICAGAPLTMFALGATFLPSLPAKEILLTDSSLILLGVLSLAASFWRAVAERARPLGLVTGFATAAAIVKLPLAAGIGRA